MTGKTDALTLETKEQSYLFFYFMCHPKKSFNRPAVASLCCVCCLSHMWLFVTPWTRVLQAALSMGFSRQEYWSGFPCPPPGESSQPRDETCISGISCIGRWLLYQWLTGYCPLIFSGSSLCGWTGGSLISWLIHTATSCNLFSLWSSFFFQLREPAFMTPGYGTKHLSLVRVRLCYIKGDFA